MARSQVTLVFAGDTSSLERAFGRAEKAGSKLGGALKTLGKAGALAGFAALAVSAKVGWDEFMEGQKVSAQTAAALKSTGGAAHVTAAQIDALSSALMRKSGVDDEAIKSGANLLLTFTNVRNEAGKGRDIFTQATAAALDLSVAFGKDMASSSILVGKALNDPIKGISALSKVGVTFTQSQKDAIKSMVAMGDTAGAQKLILAELARETGGSAAALGKTLPGQIEIAKQQFSNLAGEVVGKLVPAFLAVVNWVRTNWPQIRATFETVMAAVRSAIDVAIVWIKANLVPAIQGVIAAAKAAWDRFGPIVMAAFTAVKNIVAGAIAQVKAIIELAMALLSGDWGKAWGKLKEIVGNALKQIVTIVTGFASVLLAAARVLGQAIWDGIQAGLAGLAQLPGKLLRAVSDAVGSLFTYVGQAFLGIGKAIVQGIWNGISGMGGWLAEKVKGFAGSFIKNAFQSALDIFSPSQVMAEQVGKPIVQGVAAGIDASGDLITAAIKKAVGGAIAAGKKAAQKAPPLTSALLEAMGLTVPGKVSPGTMAAALAGLTADAGDDLRAFQTLVTEAETGFALAVRSGVHEAIVEAAGVLKSARETLAGLGPMAAGGGALIQGSGADERMGLLTQILSGKAGPAATAAINLNVNSQSLDPTAAATAVVKALQEYVRHNGPLAGVAA